MLSIACQAISQKTKISGIVIDDLTEERMPFVNIYFQGTKVGVMSDQEGKFILESFYATDSLVISFIGYDKCIIAIQKDISQNFEIRLKESTTNLQEIIVLPSETNPAHPIIKRVLANKKINNREKLDAYQYEVYNKIQLDLNNITEEFKNTKAFEKFNFIFDNIDTSESKPFLPIFISESISDYYFKKNPKTHKEIIKASKVSGIDNKSIAQFTGDMYQQVNIYNNQLSVFGKNFISPIANQSMLYYKYYLIDSLNVDGNWCYELQFLPKRKGELTFEGTLWVHDTTYAIKKVTGSISKDANINFVNELKVTQTFEQVEKEVWILTKDELFVDFEWLDKALGFYGKKATLYKDFIINDLKEEPFYSGAENIFIKDSANNRSEKYWEQQRHESLTDQQKGIYHMIDTLQKVPIVRTYVDVIYLLASGYKIIGKFELGEYTSLYSFNDVEGHRFRATIRTSNNFSKMIEFSSFAAYGLWDKEFKYGLGTRFFITKEPRRMVHAVFKHDVEQIGLSSNAYNNTGVVSSFLRRNPFNKLVFNTEYRFSYSREWFHGLTTSILFRNANFQPLGIIPFNTTDENGLISSKSNIITSEVSFNTRFAFGEKFISGEFDRVSTGTKFPVIEFNYGYGLPDLFNSEFEYHRLKLSIEHNIRLGILGSTQYNFEGGKIIGNVPFPLLEVHPGNETWSYNDNAFNMMNICEFVSDEYISFKLQHHFNGLVFNKIPYLRKLKWREVATFQGVWGSLSEDNQNNILLPEYTSSLRNKPYLESSLGIENIFKFLRIDVIWRLSYLDNEFEGIKVSPLGLRAKLQLDF